MTDEELEILAGIQAMKNELAELRTFRDQHTAQLDALGRENATLRELLSGAVVRLEEAQFHLREAYDGVLDPSIAETECVWLTECLDRIAAALAPKVSSSENQSNGGGE